MTTESKPQTVKEWLHDLADSQESTEKDSAIMQKLLHRAGFTAAVCTCGIVYLDGHGTMEAPPTSIHAIARMLVKQVETGTAG